MSTNHRITTALTATAVGLLAAATVGAGAAIAAPPAGAGTTELRVATYNLSLNRNAAGQLVADLGTTTNAQAKTVAEVIQRVNPDVVLLNEFDFVAGGVAADLFRENYLELSQGGADPVVYPYAYVAPSNTGIPSGFDLNNNGVIGGGDDAFGFGAFPGQFGMAVLSKYPIETERGAHVPALPLEGHARRTAARRPEHGGASRLVLGRRARRVPPLEQVALGRAREGRSHDRARARLAPDPADVRRRRGPQRPSQPRRDPVLGRLRDARQGVTVHPRRRRKARWPQAGRVVRDPRRPERRPARRRLGRPGDRPTARLAARIIDPQPTSDGAAEAAVLQGGANLAHEGDPALDTADFNDIPAPGNLRADYVLPSKDLRVLDAGVFWPVQADPLSALTGVFPFPSSDHRLVWVDVKVRG